eukprot:GHVR01025299.1.p1 GENE.GHVR01025299.1~~GHVR01025299.1.p1  ORF type:complete len:144 (+),score=13.14 GHVR01025299.1:174-605(+)
MIDFPLVSLRFLLTMAQAVLLITMLVSRDVFSRMTSGITTYNDTDQVPLTESDTEVLILTAVALGFIVVEWIGFVSGLTLFNRNVNVISTTLHLGGCITLSVLMIDEYPHTALYYTLPFISLIPFILEVWNFVEVVLLKRVIY